MKTKFLKIADSENTGGNIVNDILLLNDFKVIVITHDMIYYYNSLDDYYNNDEPINCFNR